jgi:hypothetical protein
VNNGLVLLAAWAELFALVGVLVWFVGRHRR